MLLGSNDDLCLYVSVDIYLVTGSGSFLLFCFENITASTVHLHELFRVITISHTMNIAACVCYFVFRFVLIFLVALIISSSSKVGHRHKLYLAITLSSLQARVTLLKSWQAHIFSFTLSTLSRDLIISYFIMMSLLLPLWSKLVY